MEGGTSRGGAAAASTSTVLLSSSVLWVDMDKQEQEQDIWRKTAKRKRSGMFDESTVLR